MCLCMCGALITNQKSLLAAVLSKLPEQNSQSGSPSPFVFRTTRWCLEPPVSPACVSSLSLPESFQLSDCFFCTPYLHIKGPHFRNFTKYFWEFDVGLSLFLPRALSLSVSPWVNVFSLSEGFPLKQESRTGCRLLLF